METMKNEIERRLTENELQETCNETALIIEDADFGLVCIVPLKNGTYSWVLLSKDSRAVAYVGMVLDLRKVYIRVLEGLIAYLIIPSTH